MSQSQPSMSFLWRRHLPSRYIYWYTTTMLIGGILTSIKSIYESLYYTPDSYGSVRTESRSWGDEKEKKMSQSPVDKPHDGQKQPKFVHYGLKPLERRISLSSAQRRPCVGQRKIRPKDVGIPQHTDLFAFILTTPQRHNQKGLLHNWKQIVCHSSFSLTAHASVYLW